MYIYIYIDIDMYDLTRLARQARTQNEGVLAKDAVFTGEPLFWSKKYVTKTVLAKWTDHFRGRLEVLGRLFLQPIPWEKIGQPVQRLMCCTSKVSLRANKERFIMTSGLGTYTVYAHTDIYIYIYHRFPKMGVPPVIIYLNRSFHHKPSILVWAMDPLYNHVLVSYVQSRGFN